MKRFKSSQTRGHTRFDWLESRHSFSFGHHYDPNNVRWGPLRVINDDRIAPGAGFPEHPHNDMEIFSYVTSGSLAHRDSLGNEASIHPGRIQYMSAGSGIRHSEFNPSTDEPTRLLQIWIDPSEKGLPPAYTELDIDSQGMRNNWLLLLSPDGSNGSIPIRQDTRIFVTHLEPGNEIEVPSTAGRKGYLHLIDGQLSFENTQMGSGDAIELENEGSFVLKASQPSEILYFDLPA